VVEEHDLEEALATSVTRVVAALATLSVIEALAPDDVGGELELEQLLLARRVFGLALLADLADESLRDDRLERRREHVRLDAEVHHARHDRRRVVGVERREDEVPREGGLDRDLRRLEVADLADQDRVGVLAQDRAEAARVGEADLLVDLDLDDTVE